jgi:hypothetical protein
LGDSDEFIRTPAKRLGCDDKVRIPMRTVSSVRLGRQIGGDVVTVKTVDATYDWKLSDDDAKQLVAELTTYGK